MFILVAMLELVSSIVMNISTLPLVKAFVIMLLISMSFSLKSDGTLVERSICLLFSDLISTVIFFVPTVCDDLP